MNRGLTHSLMATRARLPTPYPRRGGRGAQNLTDGLHRVALHATRLQKGGPPNSCATSFRHSVGCYRMQYRRVIGSTGIRLTSEIGRPPSPPTPITGRVAETVTPIPLQPSGRPHPGVRERRFGRKFGRCWTGHAFLSPFASPPVGINRRRHPPNPVGPHPRIPVGLFRRPVRLDCRSLSVAIARRPHPPTPRPHSPTPVRLVCRRACLVCHLLVWYCAERRPHVHPRHRRRRLRRTYPGGLVLSGLVLVFGRGVHAVSVARGTDSGNHTPGYQGILGMKSPESPLPYP